MMSSLVAYQTIVHREVSRFLRIWLQTLFPPVITQTLYFVIFGKFIGSQLGQIAGVSYMSFIVPGLVMMAVITNSYANVVSSFFSSKFQRNIEEVLVSPTPSWVIMAGYVTGGVLRGVIVGFLVFAVSVFFTHPQISHPGLIALFIVLTATVFALGGLANGILARSFDDVSIIPTFVLTPLTYLGGVFYSIASLPLFWQKVSLLNPILYMVNGFRFGFYGFSDVHVAGSAAILILFTMILGCINLHLLKRGIGLKN